MGDAYWRYGADPRQQAALPPLVGKRPRSEYDAPVGHELPSYFSRDDRVLRDADPMGAPYDRYMRSAQLPPYGGVESARPMSGGLNGRIVDDPRAMGISGGRSRTEMPLPSDASSTLFVEGLPGSCSRREVAHIFRPFVGYKEVRLVTKESKSSKGDPLVLCFVDFASPAHAATAMDALQGYKFDEHERDSVSLRLQFARHPGARTGGGGHRGRR